MKAAIGNWIRFYRDARLVIGVVQYIEKDITGNYGKWEYVTDIGTVREDRVKEVRREQNND